MSSIPLRNHRFEDICPQRTPENHRFENICSPFPLKIITWGTFVFNATVSGPRRTYVPNICPNYIDNTYARDGRGPSHHLCCQRVEIWGFTSPFPLENHKFDDMCLRAPLQIIDLRTHVLVPRCKSQIGEHMSSLRRGNYRLEIICPLALAVVDLTRHALLFTCELVVCVSGGVREGEVGGVMRRATTTTTKQQPTTQRRRSSRLRK